VPESTVELLKRAVEAQAKVIDKPVPDRRELQEETLTSDTQKKGKQG
jgi:hypothetical protein